MGKIHGTVARLPDFLNRMARHQLSTVYTVGETETLLTCAPALSVAIVTVTMQCVHQFAVWPTSDAIMQSKIDAVLLDLNRISCGCLALVIHPMVNYNLNIIYPDSLLAVGEFNAYKVWLFSEDSEGRPYIRGPETGGLSLSLVCMLRIKMGHVIAQSFS